MPNVRRQNTKLAYAADWADFGQDVAGVVSALQGAIDTLRQQLVRADTQNDELRARKRSSRIRTKATTV
jgi:hypothetical protein